MKLAFTDLFLQHNFLDYFMFVSFLTLSSHIYTNAYAGGTKCSPMYLRYVTAAYLFNCTKVFHNVGLVVFLDESGMFFWTAVYKCFCICKHKENTVIRHLSRMVSYVSAVFLLSLR